MNISYIMYGRALAHRLYFFLQPRADKITNTSDALQHAASGSKQQDDRQGQAVSYECATCHYGAGSLRAHGHRWGEVWVQETDWMRTQCRKRSNLYPTPPTMVCLHRMGQTFPHKKLSTTLGD